MLEKKYNHKEVENGKYDAWMKSHLFEAGDKSKEPFTIVIPPPNVTGNLHLGHALNTSIQDTIIRYKKMKGFDTLWLPGMDHAAIATEAKVVNRLKEQGINKYELGREGFLKECWKWTDEHRSNIHKQWETMGLCVDYTRERFTLDSGLNDAVNAVFIKLYNEGLIYRGEKIINWDPVAKTALSNEEVIYEEDAGAFYHIKYFIEGTKDYLDVATTRPETLFGDTAVAVNPEDKRYKDLIGKNVILPIVNKLIPIIGDEHADPEFGTGCVKITPAHDPNDFEVGNRHNLERIIIMNEDATMNELTGKYNGMTREECRSELLKDLEKEDLLINVEKMTHSVGHSERTHSVVEPYLSKQWFVNMKSMSEDLLNAQKSKDKKIHFIPKRFEKILNHWMEDCHDWCISRQLWWGHRIPAWYKDEEVKVQVECPGEGWIQDNDVLDTWFSSALWPFSTLGWPNKTEDLERYFPTDVLVTAYDIIFFWVARMAFTSLKQMNDRPFKDCIIHGLIRDKQGRKMSKSLGNGIDPMDMIDEYGCDALRFYLTTTSAMGMDIRFDTEKVASTWNFINKLWNASRFVLMKLENFRKEDYSLENLNNADKWILTKLNETIASVTKSMDKYEFNNAGSCLYSFIWDNFCDKYIEMSKFSETNSTKSTLLYTITCIIKMLHPFMPFVTEEIYSNFEIKDTELLLQSEYPTCNKKQIFKQEAKEIGEMLEYVTLFRNKKLENKISNEIEVIDYNKNTLLNKMLKLEDKIVEKPTYKDLLTIELYNYKFDLYFDNSKNNEEEKQKIEEEIIKLTASIERRKKLLSNENYVNKAPEAIVNKEREDLAKEEHKLEILKKN
ncbi:MAG: valine--tRNA ligase [Tenericutes bacterium]|nr:valine--tRNA ligase [Mycoplasmatota bacterium]